MKSNKISLTDNTRKRRFEFDLENQLGIIDYSIQGKKIILTHTRVPDELRGKGYGGDIVELALQEAKERGLTVVPQCSFVASYIDNNPAWQTIVEVGEIR